LRERVGAGDAHRPRRRWLAAVLVFFCLPLFVNLGTTDLDNDEAIYSFAVDRMVASGDWLVPRMIATADGPFLEKPPLKFWMVASPIRAGWLPADEFGLRFWDALFGAASFVYVFLIGAWLLNPLCGFISVLFLFAHAPLLFSHGLRSNTMDSALVLAYCGGIYHYLRWIAPFVVRTFERSSAGERTTNDTSGFSRTLHVFAVALYFVLGFMTKFVAALFLPAILGLTALLVREHRCALARDWRTWALAAAFAVALIAPWFVFASVRFGSLFWQTIVGVHVYERFTSALDPGHLHPWHYYLGQVIDFWETGALVLVGGGVGLIAGWTTWRFAPSAIVLVIWLLPLLVISAVTSKLYHYAFPFLPPLALMGGYAAAIVPAVGWAPFDRALDRAYAHAATRFPAAVRVAQGGAVRVVLALAIALCVVLAVGGLIFGRVELIFGNAELASAGVLRPGLAAFVLAVLLMPSRRFRRWLLLLLVGSFLPLQGYRDSLALLGAGSHPRRSVSACIRAVQAAGGQPGGMRIDEPLETISHSVFYYFDRIRPWRHGPSADDLPALVRSTADFQQPLAALGENMALTLPPPYAACGSVAGHQ
jgi:4-amino-4-deoxy-L-arabinose transferase-like glycosyltransferase